jgi:hypothetical protein
MKDKASRVGGFENPGGPGNLEPKEIIVNYSALKDGACNNKLG